MNDERQAGGARSALPLAHFDRLQEALVVRYRDRQAAIAAVASALAGS